MVWRHNFLPFFIFRLKATSEDERCRPANKEENIHTMMPRTTHTTDRGVVLRRRTGDGPVAFTSDDMADDDTQSSEDLFSLAPSDRLRTYGGDTSSQRMSSSWDVEPQQRMKGFDEIANRQLLPEETELMIRKFERAADIPFSRTYQMGRYVKTFPLPTRTPQIGLVVLPGADLPEVNRLEQAGMVSSSPDQRVSETPSALFTPRSRWVH